MNDVGSIALLVSVVSLLGTLTTVVRLFTRTEARVEVAEEKIKETSALARLTADRVQGEAYAAHSALVARVDHVEDAMQRMASNERVDAVMARMEQGFRHLEDVIRREISKTTRTHDDRSK